MYIDYGMIQIHRIHVNSSIISRSIVILSSARTRLCTPTAEDQLFDLRARRILRDGIMVHYR